MDKPPLQGIGDILTSDRRKAAEAQPSLRLCIVAADGWWTDPEYRKDRPETDPGLGPGPWPEVREAWRVGKQKILVTIRTVQSKWYHIKSGS